MPYFQFAKYKSINKYLFRLGDTKQPKNSSYTWVMLPQVRYFC